MACIITQQSRQKNPSEKEDAILQKIFQVSLTESSSYLDRKIYLEMTAAEFLSEDRAFLLNTHCMERILVDRLLGHFHGAEPPFSYLVGCFRRASEEEKKIANIKDHNIKSQLVGVVKQAKQLAVSYCRLHLSNPDLFPDSDEHKPSISQLLPLLLNKFDVTRGDSSGLPPGFFDEFFTNSDFETLEPILKGLYEDLRARVVKVSALGNFQQALDALVMLSNSPHGAKALVNHPFWIPKGTHVNGRAMEIDSILGSFFHVSALPDNSIFKSEPDCLLDPSSVKVAMNYLCNGLTNVLGSLLKNNNTHEGVLDYLAEIINKNSSRAHIQMNPTNCASLGTFVNLSAVMLRLCEPFLDPALSKRNRIDLRYVHVNTRLDLRDLTCLQASSSYKAQMGSPSSKFPFICECFFMTARVLHLGLIKAFSDFNCILQELARCQDILSTLESLNAQECSPLLDQEIRTLQEEIEEYSLEKQCYEAQLMGDDVTLIRSALNFYRLMVVWLMDLVGGFKMPLPSSYPPIFACIPEHFVEDAMDLLIFASLKPRALELDRFYLDDYMNFIVMFMASPEYIRNPYLRAKMVQVLNTWIPKGDSSGSSSTDALFEGKQLICEYLVPNLLKLYIDIEHTGAHTQFYDKFNVRHNITKLLEYLWQVPSHRNIWRRVAKKEEKGVYLSFLSCLLSDTIHLLDEGLNTIQELKQIQDEMSTAEEWSKRSAQERDEKTRQLHNQENIIRVDMKLGMGNVGILSLTTEQITAPLLVPEMVERVANMLNYFLSRLAGPQRKSLALTDPEKYKFRPKELLKKIVGIYIHLARGDDGNVYPAAISRDGRSYNEQLFTSTAEILQGIGEHITVIHEFSEIGQKAKAAALKATEVDAFLGEIPDEFLDAIQYTLMRDPVKLPSSNVTLDRPVIQRHLLSDSTDPFTRAPLTEDMLIPDSELKARIQKFVTFCDLERHQDVERAHVEQDVLT